MNKSGLKIVVLLALLLVHTVQVRAELIDFGCITGNDASGTSCAIAESQMKLEIEASGSDQVLFTFSNIGAVDSFIGSIYFMYDNFDVLVFDAILNLDSGARFREGAHPSHLPAYDSRPASFSAEADVGRGQGNRGGRGHNGINQGESLGILFDLVGATYDDVYAALLSGDLVIGIHAQGLGENNEYSESLVAMPPMVVPVPAAAWLFSFGLLTLVGWIKRSS